MTGFECAVTDPLCCQTQGGEPQGPGSACESQACCLEHPFGVCVDDVDVESCLFGGGVGSLAPGMMCQLGMIGCCLPDHSCGDFTPDCCDAIGGVPQEGGGLCAADEACCLEDGSCAMLPPGCCSLANGTSQGSGSDCGNVQACCLDDAQCVMRTAACCVEEDGIARGNGTTCAVDLEACHTFGFGCEMGDPACCALTEGGSQGPDSECEERGCCINWPGTGYCFNGIDPEVCIIGGGIGSLDPGHQCDGGSSVGCCMPDNTCIDVTELCCEDLGGTQFTGQCGWDTVACCLPNAQCANLTPGCCDVQGGTSLGAGTSCTPSGSHQACSLPGFDCAFGDPVCCADEGGQSQGSGSVCEEQGCCVVHSAGVCISEVDVQSCLMNGGVTSLPPGQTCDAGVAKGCCLPNSTCVNLTPKCCTAMNGVQQVGLCGGGSCSATQACCLPNGSCSLLTPSACLAGSGEPQGPGTTCKFRICSVVQEAEQ